jgi:hypothetical protein
VHRRAERVTRFQGQIRFIALDARAALNVSQNHLPNYGPCFIIKTVPFVPGCSSGE